MGHDQTGVLGELGIRTRRMPRGKSYTHKLQHDYKTMTEFRTNLCRIRQSSLLMKTLWQEWTS